MKLFLAILTFVSLNAFAAKLEPENALIPAQNLVQNKAFTLIHDFLEQHPDFRLVNLNQTFHQGKYNPGDFSDYFGSLNFLLVQGTNKSNFQVECGLDVRVHKEFFSFRDHGPEEVILEYINHSEPQRPEMVIAVPTVECSEFPGQ